MFFLLIIGKPKNKHITIIKKATSSSVYIDILFMINKDVSIHEKLSHTKVELIKGV